MRPTARNEAAPGGWHRPRPQSSSPDATGPRYRAARADAAEPAALGRIRVYAAGVVYHAARLALGGGGSHYRALVALLERLRAEAARLYDGRRAYRGGRT